MLGVTKGAEDKKKHIYTPSDTVTTDETGLEFV